MSDTPRACPNLGVDCEFPDCTFLEPECAAANAEPEPEPEPVRAQRIGETWTLFPITVNDIKWEG
jgi:hypothetical protein